MKIESFYGATILLSEKSDGNMRCTSEINNHQHITEFVERIIHPTQGLLYAIPYLQHGAEATSVEFYSGFEHPLADAVMTNKRGVVLGVGYADCPTVFLVDAKHHAIGIAHCGWRGLKAGVIGNLINKMMIEYNSRSYELVAYVGPGIEPECYPVGPDVYTQFFPLASLNPDTAVKFNLNLLDIITTQLMRNGVRAIQYNTDCTKCELAPSGDFKYFSGRRTAKDAPLETNMAFITLQ